MCIFKNKKVKYFKSPSTVHHENRYFSENKKVLQYKNPLKTIPKILKFSMFRSKNAFTIPREKVTIEDRASSKVTETVSLEGRSDAVLGVVLW